LKRLLPTYAVMAVLGLGILAGGGALIEMVYHLQLNAAMGDELSFLGVNFNVRSVASWGGAMVVLMVSLGLFEWVRRSFKAQWSVIQTAIEKEIKRREAAL
jgi:branched-chain amino acid transport system permease protein